MDRASTMTDQMTALASGFYPLPLAPDDPRKRLALTRFPASPDRSMVLIYDDDMPGELPVVRLTLVGSSPILRTVQVQIEPFGHPIEVTDPEGRTDFSIEAGRLATLPRHIGGAERALILRVAPYIGSPERDILIEFHPMGDGRGGRNIKMVCTALRTWTILRQEVVERLLAERGEALAI